MPTELYRVRFTVSTPVSENDFRAITAVNAGNYRKGSSFEEFTAYTRSFDEMTFHSTPLPIDRAVELKLRFNGEIKHV